MGVIILASAAVPAQNPSPPETSRCHVFIDHQFIWTFEMVDSSNGGTVPVLNIITFEKGVWEFRPEQIHILNRDKREAEVNKFSIDTGVIGEPYDTPYLRVRGNSFIGMDLLGEFGQFSEPAEVVVDLGDDRYRLEPMDCLDFGMLAEKINRVNFDSPDIREDFHVLQIPLMGTIEPRPKF